MELPQDKSSEPRVTTPEPTDPGREIVVLVIMYFYITANMCAHACHVHVVMYTLYVKESGHMDILCTENTHCGATEVLLCPRT